MLLLNLTPNDIEKKYGLEFIHECDGLDWYQGSHYYEDLIGPIVFKKYDNSPTDGIILYVDTGCDTLKSIELIVKQLAIDDKLIMWKSAF